MNIGRYWAMPWRDFARARRKDLDMRLTPDAQNRMDTYLREIEKHLARKDEPVRKELLAELREHIEEALRRRCPERAEKTDVEAVLSEMDPPESFAESSAGVRASDASSAPPAASDPSAAPRRPSRPWFFLALGFLLVNSYAVWKWTQAPAAGVYSKALVVAFETDPRLVTNRQPLVWIFNQPTTTATGDVSEIENPPFRIDPPIPGRFSWPSHQRLVFEPDAPWPACQVFRARPSATLEAAGATEVSFNSEPLALLSVEQENLSPAREATFRFVFNGAPDSSQLPKYLHLSEQGKLDLRYELVGAAGSNTVLIRTETTTRDLLMLTLKAGLPARGAPLSLAQDITRQVPIANSFAFSRLRTASPAFGPCEVSVFFNQPPDMNSAASQLDISPTVRFTTEPTPWWESSGVKLVGDFKPGATYRITLKEGLESVNGISLGRDVVRVAQVPDRVPSLAISAPGRYLSPRGRLTIPVSAVNLRECRVSLAPVFANNLVQLALREAGRVPICYGNPASKLTGRETVWTNKLPDRRNEEIRCDADLRKLVTDDPHGAYLLRIGAETASEETRLLVVTDLGISARLAKDGALVWVNSLRDARPVAGAKVTLYAENNQPLAQGTTGTNGLVLLNCRTDDPAAPPFLVVAQLGGDLSYIDLDRSRVSVTGNRDGRPYLAADAIEAFVFTERGIYRPGETIHMKALVRDSKLEAPQPMPVLFRVLRPDGRVFKDFPVEIDANGAAEVSATMPDYLPTGRYTIQLALPGTFTSIGETSAAIEDFVPPQIRVDVKAEAERAPAGESLSFSVHAEHLFGRAASGLRAQGSMTFRTAPFAHPAWKGWLFGDDEKTFATMYRPIGNLTLDEKGMSVFSAETVEAWRPPAAILAICSATVIEPSGRPLTATASTFVDAYPFYVGLRPAFEGAVRAGETQRVSVVEVLSDGAAASKDKPLQVRLARANWTYALKKNSRGCYEYISERVLTTVREDTIAAGGIPTEFAFAAPSSGEYLLTFSDPASGASSSLRFFASAPEQEWVAWSLERPDTVGLTADQPSYRPGDKARVMIKAPFPGLALVTIESDRILASRLLAMEQNTAEVEFDMLPDYTPNVYCCITMIRPAIAESTWTAHRAVGAVALKIEPPGKRLAVSLDAPPTNCPQSALRAKIRVRDESGAPAQGEAVVMAVDEAICMLTDFETPDPMAWFLSPRASEVSLYDIYSDLFPLIEEETPDTAPRAGGDDGGALRKRLNPVRANRFKPVALWESGVTLDTNGEAVVSFNVPEFTGQLRLMAIAYNHSQAGSGEAVSRIRRPIVVQSSLPRFLAPKDKCDATIALFNDSGRDEPVRIRVLCGGPLSAPEELRPVTLANRASEVVRAPLVAGAAPGLAFCTVEVMGEDTTYRETIELSVRPAAGLQVRTEVGALAAGETKAIAAPTNWIAGSVTGEVWCSGEPGIRLGRALEYVMDYPYGCLEQTVSSALPLLYLSDLAVRVLPGSVARTDAEPFVQAAILRVLSMQQADGAFALWPYQRASYFWTTAYAAHFLVEAGRASFAVPEDRLLAALDSLRKRLDQDPPADCATDSSERKQDLEERAYACMILAIADRPDHGWNARLREQADQLTLAARAHAASALMLAGEPRQARKLLDNAGLPAAGRPRDSGSAPGSAVRDAALLLLAWLDLDPAAAQAAEFARFIERQQQDGHWFTTQDDAMALLALGRYARLARADARPFTATLTLPGNSTCSATDQKELHVGLALAALNAARITNAGPGKLYYVIRAEGVPESGAVPEEDKGIAVRRSYLSADGQPLDIRTLKQGDLVVVRISIDTAGTTTDNIAIEELLPAGLEIENPNLATSQQFAWINQKSDPALYRDIRDDRLLIFTGPVSGTQNFYYAARAVTPGQFVYPPVSAACMYDPEIRSTQGRTEITVMP
jgi:alpha-2-macroglobulin